ncbi:unnamed protein product, partial [Ixodes hexagonus]
VEGLCFSHVFSDATIEAILSYQAKPGDVVVAGYPKSGTKWMQFIIFSILNDGDRPRNVSEFMPKAQFANQVERRELLDAPRAGATKTHLPFRQASFCEEAKYIFVCRNPYDVCVSYYHHTTGLPAYRFENGTFDEYLDMFLAGEVDLGDYFDHLLSWYEQREKPNVLLITYEDIKADPKDCVLKVADFLGEEYSVRLWENPQILERILMVISAESMKSFNDEYKNTWREGRYGQAPDGATSDQLKKPTAKNFIRKGIVGDWEKYFTAHHVRKMKARIDMKLAHVDVMNLWKAVNLP